MKGIVAIEILISQTRKGPSSLAAVQITIFIVLLGVPTSNKELQTYMKGIVAIEILFFQTRKKDLAALLGYK